MFLDLLKQESAMKGEIMFKSFYFKSVRSTEIMIIGASFQDSRGQYGNSRCIQFDLSFHRYTHIAIILWLK